MNYYLKIILIFIPLIYIILFLSYILFGILKFKKINLEYKLKNGDYILKIINKDNKIVQEWNVNVSDDNFKLLGYNNKIKKEIIIDFLFNKSKNIYATKNDEYFVQINKDLLSGIDQDNDKWFLEKKIKMPKM